MQGMFIKDLEELKNKETEMHNTLEGINSRITEAEERITDLVQRVWRKGNPPTLLLGM